MTSEDIEVLKLNPYKNHISPIMYRACVGNNSGVNVHSRDCSIIDGYKESVDILGEYVNITKAKGYMDETKDNEIEME